MRDCLKRLIIFHIERNSVGKAFIKKVQFVKNMEITILGTSSMIPTKDRNHTSIFLSHKGEGILMDCGEGTQRQMKLAGIRPSKIKKILISHWHGDHTLGLPGLLQTMAGTAYEGTVKIFGPSGTKEHFEHMMKAFPGDLRTLTYEIKEVEDGKIYDGSDIIIKSYKLDHNIPCVGYRIEEKDRRRINVNYVKKIGIGEGPLMGKLQKGENVKFKGKEIKANDATYIVKGKIVGYIADTNLCANMSKIAKDCDVLISESTYEEKEKEKALEYDHLTSVNGAEIASNNNVKKLVLIHFSQRYKTVDKIEEEARTIFPETVCGYDFMKIKV